ncbi:MAG: outer membrane beta-barrel protein [Gemmatimonadaceae bacterium]|nr:outer membrane beta-barrel protein [Gemmatimonadaceae bacterium]
MSTRSTRLTQMLVYARMYRERWISLLMATTCASVAHAQQSSAAASRSDFAVRPIIGAYVPTGDQRDVLRDAFHLGIQGSYDIIPKLSVVGTFAWSASEARGIPSAPKIDLFHYDAGLEARTAGVSRSSGWSVAPFAGLGLGARTYRVRSGSGGNNSKFAGYGALGAEARTRRIGVRIEARDYLSEAGPTRALVGSGTRNDVTLAAGLTIRF